MNSYKKLALSVALGALLTACNSNNDSSNNSATPTPTAKTISGTAAAGAPIVGQVTIKDANGVLKTVNLDINGKYSIDVTGLTAPFVFRAQGKAGTRTVSLFSAATSEDINHTINITPFTDLMIANLAGQAAEKYFENPVFSKLTTDELNSARTVLTQRLLPALTSLGVPGSFDLLRSAFSANHTGFDAVMDTVQVTVDPATNKASITDLINNQKIIDDLASKTDNTLLPTPVIPLAGAIADLQAIESQLKAFSALFSKGLPTDAALRPFLVNDGSYLDAGDDLETGIHNFMTDSEMIGVTLNQPTIVERVNDTELRIEFQVNLVNEGLSTYEVIFKKDGSVWKIKGDQKPFEHGLQALNVFYKTDVKFERKLDLSINHVPPAVSYIKITGAGLSAPLLMQRTVGSSSRWGYVKADNSVDSTSWLSECGEQAELSPCIDFSKVPSDTVYTFQALDQNKQPILKSFTDVLPRSPVTNADAQANVKKWFADVTSVTPANYGSIVNGTNISVSVATPTDSAYVFRGLSYSADGTRVESHRLGADGKTVNLTWSGSTPTSQPGIDLWTKDSYGRRFLTVTSHP